MKQVSITEAKNNLRALIDGLKTGSSVLIVDRGRPVARLEPIQPHHLQSDDRRERLVREGAIRPGRGAVSKELFTTPPPRLRKNASAVRALLEERRTGR